MTDKPYIIKEGLIVEGSIQADNLALEGVSLEDLLDVNLSTPPSNLQALVYNSSQNKWVPNTISYVADLDDLTDVDLTTTPPTEGQTLIWNSSQQKFYPANGSIGNSSIEDLADVVLGENQPASDGRALIYQDGKIISGPVIGGVSYTPSSGDVSYSFVQLLMNFNGTHNSTTFVDQSPSPRTITPTAQAIISTTQSKFGGSSLFLNGNSYLGFPAITIGSNEDFTLEAFIYTASASDSGILGSASAGNFQMFTLVGGKLGFYWNGPSLESSTTVPLNQWVHIAMTRASGMIRFFVNGTLDPVTMAGNTSALNIGYIGYAAYRSNFNGYIDSIRITKVARYTSSFTVPSTEFPASSANPVAIPYSVGNLDDVDITTTPPTNGQTLIWSSVDGTFVPGDAGSGGGGGGGGTVINSIDDIADVNLSALQPPSDGRALIYQNGEFISGPVIGGVSYLVSSNFDPATLGTNLVAWYDASDASTITLINDKVSQVNDKSSYARHITQTTISDRPTYEIGTFNGKNALAWPTSNNGVNLKNSSSISFKEVFVVCQYINTEAPNNFGQYATTVSGYNEIITTGLGTGFYTTNFDLFYLNGDNSTNRASNAFPDIKTLGLLRANKSTTGVVTDSGGLVIGCDRTYSDENNSFINRGWMGYICEILILDTTVSPSTRIEIESYLASKWGFVNRLPAGHPSTTPVSIPYSIGNFDDVDIATNPPADGELLGWSAADEAFVPVAPSSTSSLNTQVLSNTATSLAAGGVSDFTLTAGAVSLLLSFTASFPCWVRVYGTAAARTADTRTAPGGTPPSPGNDFYAEAVTTTAAQTIRFSPVPTLQGTSSLVYVRAVNMDTVSRSIVMDFSVLTLEA